MGIEGRRGRGFRRWVWSGEGEREVEKVGERSEEKPGMKGDERSILVWFGLDWRDANWVIGGFAGEMVMGLNLWVPGFGLCFT